MSLTLMMEYLSKGRVLENQERDKCHKNDEIPGIYSNILSDH